MGNKQVQILSIILLCLVAVYFGDVIFNGSPKVETPEWQLDEEAVMGIEVRNSSEFIRLKKTEDGWKILKPSEMKADKEQVERFLIQIQNLKPSRVMTSRTDQYEDYGLSKSDETVVLLMQADKTETLHIGKNGTKINTLYARFGEGEEVLLAQGSVQRDTDVNLWRDKAIFSTQSTEINTISIKSPGEDFALSNSDGAWTLSKNNSTVPVDSAAVTTWLEKLLQQRVISYRKDVETKTVADSSQTQVSLSMKDGGIQTLHLFENEQEILGILEGGLEVFEVPEEISSVLGEIATLQVANY